MPYIPLRSYVKKEITVFAGMVEIPPVEKKDELARALDGLRSDVALDSLISSDMMDVIGTLTSKVKDVEELRSALDLFDIVKVTFHGVTNKAEALAAHYARLQSSHNTLQQSHNTLSREVDKLGDRYATLAEQMKELNSELASLSSSVDGLTSEVNSFKGYVSRVSSKVDRLDTSVDSLRGEVRDLKSKIDLYQYRTPSSYSSSY